MFLSVTLMRQGLWLWYRDSLKELGMFLQDSDAHDWGFWHILKLTHHSKEVDALLILKCSHRLRFWQLWFRSWTHWSEVNAFWFWRKPRLGFRHRFWNWPTWVGSRCFFWFWSAHRLRFLIQIQRTQLSEVDASSDSEVPTDWDSSDTDSGSGSPLEEATLLSDSEVLMIETPDTDSLKELDVSSDSDVLMDWDPWYRFNKWWGCFSDFHVLKQIETLDTDLLKESGCSSDSDVPQWLETPKLTHSKM